MNFYLFQEITEICFAKFIEIFSTLFRPFRSIFAAAALARLHAGGIEFAAHNMIAHARQVLNAAAADQNHRVLLQIMPHARDIGRHFLAVG